MYNKKMDKRRSLSKRQRRFDASLKEFLKENREISKSLELFEISNERYRKAIKPNIKITTSTGTKFKSFLLD